MRKSELKSFAPSPLKVLEAQSVLGLDFQSAREN